MQAKETLWRASATRAFGGSCHQRLSLPGLLFLLPLPRPRVSVALAVVLALPYSSYRALRGVVVALDAETRGLIWARSQRNR